MSLTIPSPASETESRRAAIEELYRVPENGKAEIIHGRVVQMSPTGAKPGRTAGRILSACRSMRIAGVRQRKASGTPSATMWAS